MASIREGRFRKNYGNIKFDFLTVDGIGIPPFSSTHIPGAFPKRIAEIRNLNCLDDDIILLTYPSCGTHWTNEIVNMLLQGNANYIKEAKEFTMLEALGDLQRINDYTTTRVLNTHLPYKWIPRSHIENGGKIVHTTRNPKDAYNSFYQKYKTATVTAFGADSKGMSWSQYFKTCVLGKDAIYGTWFDYEKEMALAKRTNKNIYTVHFENLKENPEAEIKGLAQFLDVKCTDDMVTNIAENCTFHNLKKADDFKAFPKDVLFTGTGSDGKPKYREKPIVYRKGEVGDWKNYFTVAQNEQFDELYEKEMKGYDVEVIY